ncbi:MAG: class I SAM-dependent methyltransferase, partial [Bryobacteraceae bacterium]
MALTYHRDFSDGLEGKYLKVVQRLAGTSKSVLELGCHTGYLTRELLSAGHRVVGIEKDPEAAGLAAAAGLPVICADVTCPSTFARISGPFDAILLMDILEHLAQPGELLQQLRPLLAENGRLLVTGPNVAYWAVRAKLALGQWDYQEAGILDRTHLRFFTAATWESLLTSAGYRVVVSEPADAMFPFEHLLLRAGITQGQVQSLRNLATHFAPNLFTIVYFLEA